MDAEVWRQAKGVLAEALLCPPDEREAFVNARCPDPSLRREVQAYLTQYDESFLESVLTVSGTFDSTSSAAAGDPNNRTPVNTSRFLINYYYRFSPMLDVGVGGGAFIFTGDGFDNQAHPVLTPIALTFTPLGFLHGEKSAKWGRVVRVKFDEKYVLGDINSLDFRSPSGYLKHGEMNRGVSVGVDLWSFIPSHH